MKYIKIISFIALTGLLCSCSNNVENSDNESIKDNFKDMGKSIGHAAKDVTKSIGHDSRNIVDGN